MIVDQPSDDETQSTWAIRLERSPGSPHVSVIVRRGVAGQRALLGTFVLSKDDARQLGADLDEAADAIVAAVASLPSIDEAQHYARRILRDALRARLNLTEGTRQ